MTQPSILTVKPSKGPSSGSEAVHIIGLGFTPTVAVRFGKLPPVTVTVRKEANLTIAEIRSPSHEPGVVDIKVSNLDETGSPIETVTLACAYQFLRTPIVRESDLTRVIRQILRELKRQVLSSVSATVSVDYDDTTEEGFQIIALAKLPSLVLSGPTLRQNRFYSANIAHEDIIIGDNGIEILRRSPPYTVDLVFKLTAASNRTAELLNLMAAVAIFLNRNRWLALPRDPDDPSLGVVRWELEGVGEFRSQLSGKNDVRVFTCGFVVRGFDVDEGLVRNFGKPVVEPEIESKPLKGCL